MNYFGYWSGYVDYFVGPVERAFIYIVRDDADLIPGSRLGPKVGSEYARVAHYCASRI